MNKKNNKSTNTSLNNKGFTLMEIIAVVIIIGILLVVGGISVTSYVQDSRAKTYESYKKDLSVASDNYLINCMVNNEEGCTIPEYGNDLRISYNELVEKGYSEKLKDPEGDGYCDKSYVIAKNTSDSGVDIEYQVCLYCSNYKSTDDGCEEINSDDVTPPTCGNTKGESTTWSKENKVIVVACSDSGIGCRKNEFSSSVGKEGQVITKGNVVIEDKAGNKTSCPVNAYVDRKAPTCKIEVEKEAINGWYKTGVTAKITSIEDEGSGVAASGMGTSLVNRDYNGKTTYDVTGGIVTVFGYVKDNVGNEGYCSKEIKVDNTKPTGTVYMGYEIYPKENSSMSNGIMTINNLSKYGNIDGVILYFSSVLTENIDSDILNSNDTSVEVTKGITKGNNKSILKITSATYDVLKISLGSTTNLNKVQKVEVIKKESTTSVWTNKDVTVYVEGKDTITGVGSYSYDNGNTYIESNIKSYSSNTTGKVIVKDKVGNVSSSYSFTIDKIDKTAPTCTLKVSSGTKGDNDWYTTNVKIAFNTHTDTGGSGVSSYGIGSVTGNKTETLSSDTAGITYTGYIEDGAGNSKTCIITVKRDATKPTCSVSGDSSTWTNSNRKITVTCGDSGSGCTQSTYSKTYSSGTTVTDTIRIQDNVGNYKDCSYNVYVDKVAPSISYVGQCSLYSPYVICSSFRVSDASKDTVKLYRSHCAHNLYYCAEACRDCSADSYKGYSAADRVLAYYNGSVLKYDNKSTINYVSYDYNSGYYSQFDMQTSYTQDTQYAFILCDTAGNCSGVYSFEYDYSEGRMK